MKTTKGYRIWQIIYPIGIYYVVSSLVFFGLELLFGNGNENYMIKQLICSAATIPFVLTFYMQDKRIEDAVYERGKFVFDGVQIKNSLLALLAGGTLGMALNNILAMTPLLRISGGFQEANSAFFGGRVIYEILGSCLLVPIAEELLFRGVVFKRLRLLIGLWPGIVLSAAIFGIMHFNLVQFVYAGVIGLLLAFLVEKTGYLYVAALAHIAANTMAVIRQDTGWLGFTYEATVSGIGATLAILAVALLLIGYMVREYQKENEK